MQGWKRFPTYYVSAAHNNLRRCHYPELRNYKDEGQSSGRATKQGGCTGWPDLGSSGDPNPPHRPPQSRWAGPPPPSSWPDKCLASLPESLKATPFVCSSELRTHALSSPAGLAGRDPTYKPQGQTIFRFQLSATPFPRQIPRHSLVFVHQKPQMTPETSLFHLPRSTSQDIVTCSLEWSFFFSFFIFIYLSGLPHGSLLRNPPANAGDVGSIPGSGRSPGEGNGSPLQYSCLEKPMDRGALQAAVHGVMKSQTRSSDGVNAHTHIYLFICVRSHLWHGASFVVAHELGCGT